MVFKDSVYSESTLYAFMKSIFTPALRPAFNKVIKSIFYNFFFCQYKNKLLSGRLPKTQVDHALDEKIPFTPSWVSIYIDFTQFWIRLLSFFIRHYGRKAFIPIRDFIYSMGDLYEYAAAVYRKNLSTTKRPFYIARPRFFMIHLLDPHLFCIPSLHVMVVIRAYTMFSVIAKQMGDEQKLKEQALEMKAGALAISQAILFVKQHSVNCIPAALYAMTNFCGDLFPPDEAENFTSLLFSDYKAKGADTPKSCRVHPGASPKIELSEPDKERIKKHILKLYYAFLEEQKTSKSWEDPLLNFLSRGAKLYQEQ